MPDETKKKRGWRKRGEHLTARERQEMPRSDFALPGKGRGPKGAGSGSYPIEDESHARSALARAAQHATPAEQREIREAVHRRFSEIDAGKQKRKSVLYDNPRSVKMREHA